MGQSQVLEAKVFHSPYGTGIAIVTGASRFTLATNIDDLKLRRLPEVQGKHPVILSRTISFFFSLVYLSVSFLQYLSICFVFIYCLLYFRSPGGADLLGSANPGPTE